MKMISAIHLMLEGKVTMSFLDSGGHSPRADKLFVTIEDASGYPGIILSIPQVNVDRWEKAIAAFNEAMEANDGADA